MPLHPVCTANNKHRIIQYLQSALHLRGKIHMPRRVKQRCIHAFPGKLRLFAENGNAAHPLLCIRIQKSVPVVHPPRFAYAAAPVKYIFR